MSRGETMNKKKTIELVGYIHKSTEILVRRPKKVKDYLKLLITLEPIKILEKIK